MKVLLDANVLVSQHFLKGHLGISLIFSLRRIGAKILMPELTLLEAKRHAVRLAGERLNDVLKAADQLQVVLGFRPSVEWPGQEAVAVAIESHLAAIEDILDHRPLDLSIVRLAIARILDKKVPAHQREEFRDSCFWEIARQTATHEWIHVVTADTDFLAGKGEQKELHPELKGEIASERLEITHHLDLPSLLEALGTESRQPDYKAIVDSLGETLRPSVELDLGAHNVVLQEPLPSTARVFIGPDPNSLVVSFQMHFAATAVSGSSPGPVAAKVIVSGSAALDPRNGTLSSIQLDNASVDYADGGRGGITYLRSADGQYRMWRPYDFRVQLPQ
jgi:hypothetical protein